MQAAHAWLWAKNNNSNLWLAAYNSLYLTSKRHNAFDYFFDTPDSLDGVYIVKVNNSFYIFSLYFIISIIKVLRKIQLWNNKKPYIKITKNIYLLLDCMEPHPEIQPFFDSLRLRPDIHVQMEQYVKDKFKGKKVIGCHIRSYSNSLPWTHHTKYWLNEKETFNHIYSQIIAIQNTIEDTSNQILFLCTDSLEVERFLKDKISNVIIYREKSSMKHTNAERHIELGVKEAENSLIEMFLLSKCDVLIRYTESWFAHYASLYVNDVFYISPPDSTDNAATRSSE